MNEKISVVLASYNGDRFIKEQIDSIIEQSYKNFELIICDDCSTDSTFDIVQQYAQKDNRVRAFRNEHNLGFKKNFEKLLSYAQYDYIALSDQDDIWMPNHLELLINNIGENDLITANAELADGNCVSLNCTLRDSDKIKNIPNDKDKAFFSLLYRNYSQGNTILLKKRLLLKAFPMPEDIEYHDSWLGIVAAAEKGIKYLDIPIILYRQHGTNITQHFKWNSFSKIKDVFFQKGSYRIYKNQLDFLKALKNWEKIENYNKNLEIDEAIVFFENLINKKSYKSIFFFCKNYSKIYLSNNFVYFFIRFILIFILQK